ncbi:hypothetical protein HK097_010575 [Rhizophlyctis rosea]|uniref:YncI copper-binding domain-containing protein n=1 Tax=Rhizophlyctis rosea TaxID=64517 RepID=A0AAD5X582_9FUNG|nr:hypothetical protein HK097_010575 [Rhizophlyctis rosea]
MQFTKTTVAACLLAAAASVQGHATIQPNAAVPGSNYYGAVRNPHGCAGSPTNNVTLLIPDNVTSVKPKSNFGPWTVSTTLRPLVPPQTAESGAVINTTIASITWTAKDGAHVLDTEYYDFEFSGKLPDGKDGDVVYFDIIQNCENGASYLWGQRPGQNVTDNTPNRTISSAPKVTLFKNGTSIKADPNAGQSGTQSAGGSSDATTVRGVLAGVGASIFAAAVYFL